MKKLLEKFIFFILRENYGLLISDTLVIDRWLWISKRLPETRENLKLLDIGCGRGAFTIKSALKGYCSTGLTWDLVSKNKASNFASKLKLREKCNFEVFDVRNLEDYKNDNFDFILNCENIEHLLDDKN